MLKRGYLVYKSVYVSYSHDQRHVDEYLQNVDEVFKLIKSAIEHDNVLDILEGPIAHEGFQRLA